MANKNEAIENLLKHISDVDLDENKITERVQDIIDKVNKLSENEKRTLLLEAITYMDLTSLKGNETSNEIIELCKKALHPIARSQKDDNTISTAAVCVYPSSASVAIKTLTDLDCRKKIKVASVAADFPNGQLPLDQRLNEIKEVVKYGVDEIDIVIDRRLSVAKNWNTLYEELKLMRTACEKKTMKSILVSGVLPDWKDIYIVSQIAILAGSDFIKTSTGKEAINATLPTGIVMCRAIKSHYNATGKKIGFKPAGGIKTSIDALQWIILIKEELGSEWLNSGLFRIGASSLLDSIMASID